MSIANGQAGSVVMSWVQGIDVMHLQRYAATGRRWGRRHGTGVWTASVSQSIRLRLTYTSKIGQSRPAGQAVTSRGNGTRRRETKKAA